MTDIRHLIDVAIGRTVGTSVAELKPAPRMITQALGQLSCEAEHAVYIGDSVGDMKAGRAAGVTTVGVGTGRTDARDLVEAGAEVVLAGFSGLKGLLTEPEPGTSERAPAGPKGR